MSGAGSPRGRLQDGQVLVCRARIAPRAKQPAPGVGADTPLNRHRDGRTGQYDRRPARIYPTFLANGGGECARGGGDRGLASAEVLYPARGTGTADRQACPGIRRCGRHPAIRTARCWPWEQGPPIYNPQHRHWTVPPTHPPSTSSGVASASCRLPKWAGCGWGSGARFRRREGRRNLDFPLSAAQGTAFAASPALREVMPGTARHRQV